MDKITPIQEIYRIINNMEFKDFREEFIIDELKNQSVKMIAAEKKFMSDVWDKGSASCYDNTKPEGPCSFDSTTHLKDKETFFKQFESNQ